MPEKQPIKDDLVDKFIQKQPRIQQNKAGFFNPINMAKKVSKTAMNLLLKRLQKSMLNKVIFQKEYVLIKSFP